MTIFDKILENILTEYFKYNFLLKNNYSNIYYPEMKNFSDFRFRFARR